MTNDNIIYAVPPHVTPTILSVTSELTKYPKENLLYVTKPGRQWRSAAVADDQIIELSGMNNVNGLFLNNANFPNYHLEKSTNGSTWDHAGPNLLRWSDDLGEWLTSGGTINTTPDYTTGPISADRSCTNCVWVTANAILYAVDDLMQNTGSRDFVGSIWARTRDPGVTATVQVSLRFGGLSDSWNSFTVTGTWQRLVVQRNAAGSTGSTATLAIRCPVGNEDLLLTAGQVTPDVTEHVGADYQTMIDTSSVRGLIGTTVLRKDTRVDRRKVLLRFGGGLSGYDYFRVNVTQDQTTDDTENYSLGAILPTTTLAVLPGKHQYPISINVINKNKKVEFDGGGVEMLALGDPKVVLTLRGTHIVRDAEAALLSIATAGLGPFLISDNMRAPGRGSDSTDEARAYAVAHTGEFRSVFDMPELLSTDFVFEEYL